MPSCVKSPEAAGLLSFVVNATPSRGGEMPLITDGEVWADRLSAGLKLQRTDSLVQLKQDGRFSSHYQAVSGALMCDAWVVHNIFHIGPMIKRNDFKELTLTFLLLHSVHPLRDFL